MNTLIRLGKMLLIAWTAPSAKGIRSALHVSKDT
jgi:hypothetical protein